MNKIKVRKRITEEDLTPRDIDLLAQSSAIPEENWFCFGTSFYRLEALGLVSDDAKITYSGRLFLYHKSREKSQ